MLKLFQLLLDSQPYCSLAHDFRNSRNFDCAMVESRMDTAVPLRTSVSKTLRSFLAIGDLAAIVDGFVRLTRTSREGCKGYQNELDNAPAAGQDHCRYHSLYPGRWTGPRAAKAIFA
jgi:hypothetical protein